MSHKDAKSVFLDVVDRCRPDDWPQALDKLCGTNLPLRHEVERLLSGHRRQFDLVKQAEAALLELTVDQPPAPEPPGTQIGPYKLREQIGEGGFGVVYVAEQEKPVARKVALKIIKPGMDTREVIARFEAERQALALMDHPNIAKVLDAGTTSEVRDQKSEIRREDGPQSSPTSDLRPPTSGCGRPYFVMELVRGVPITEFCDDHKLPTRERLQLFIDICRAVQHAHQKGVIHRDLKPSNVMVTLHDDKPVVKVIDFGISKALSSKLTDKTIYTAYGQMVGTPLYMSPEQAQLTGLDVDTRSDVYSLGVLLYELLTGTTPFDKETLQKSSFDEMRRIIREVEPPRPSARISTLNAELLSTVSGKRHVDPRKLSQSLRGELDWIVMKALEKDRGRRYESANAFAADVERYLNDEPVLACPPSILYRFRKFARRKKAALAIAAAAATAVLAGVVILAVSNVWVSWERDQTADALRDKVQALDAETAALAAETAALAKARTQETLAKKNAAEALTQQAIATEEEKSARWHLYTARMNLADQAWREGDVGSALQLLEEQRPEPGRDDPRGFEWYYLWRQCHQGHRFTLRGHRATVACVSFSPDGKTLASASGDGTIKLWEAATGHLRATLHGHGTPVNSVGFSPDGTLLASAGSDGRLRLWNPTSGQELAVIEGHTGPVFCAVFSPDGTTLASSGGGHTGPSKPGEVKLWNVGTRKVRAILKQSWGTPRCLAFSPDGKSLSQAGNWAKIVLWDLASGKEQLRFPGDRLGGGALAISPDGKTFACSGATGIVSLWNLSPQRQESGYRGHAQPVLDLEFSPDGTLLASASDDGTIKIWNRNTGQTRACGHVGRVHSVAFSPDGKTLATAGQDGAIRLWDLARMQRPVDKPTPGSKLVWCVAFSPDGKTLASAGDDKLVRLWDAATGRLRAALPGHTSHILGVGFSPDGKSLASTGDDGSVRLWDVATGQVQTILKRQKKTGNWRLAFSPDGVTLAVASGDGNVRLWDLSTEQVRSTLAGHKDWVQHVAFSPDGTMLVSGSRDGTTRVWDVRTGKPRFAIKEYLGISTFSPDSKSFASLNRAGGLRLWDAASGKERRSHAIPAASRSTRGSAFARDFGAPPASVGLAENASRTMRACAISRDFRTTAVGQLNGALRLFDVGSGRERATLKGQSQPIWSAAFSPDGKTIATGSWDGTIKFWRAATEQEVLAQSYVRDRREVQAVRVNSEAHRLRRNGRLAEAEQADRQVPDIYKKLAADYPHIPEFRFQLARSLFDLSALLTTAGRTPQAQAAHRQALAVYRELETEFPTQSEHRHTVVAALFSLANRASVTKRPGDAEPFYRECIALGEKLAREFPGDERHQTILANAYNNLGVLMGVLGRKAAAEDAYRHAVRHGEAAVAAKSPGGDIFRPNLARSLRNLAGRLQKEKRLDEATKFYRRELEVLEPANLRLAADYFARGMAHRRFRQWDKAVADFSKATEIDPANGQFWAVRGEAHFRLRQWNQAVASNSKAIERKPDVADYWNRRGVAYANLRQWQDAAGDYSRAIKLKPQQWVYYYNRALAYARLGRRQQSAADFQKALALGKDNPSVWLSVGQAYEFLGQWEQAITAYRTLVDLLPKSPVAHNNLAWSLATCPDQKLRDVTQAVAHARKAVDLQPKYGEAWNTLGVAHYRAGDWKAAVAALRKSTQLRANGGDAHDWLFLAMAHWQLAEKDKARLWYGKSVTWMAGNLMNRSPRHRDELGRFRAEAEALLGIPVRASKPLRLPVAARKPTQ